jgi:hypothetical protein
MAIGLQRGRLGDFEFQPCRREPGFGQCGVDHVDQSGVAEL